MNFPKCAESRTLSVLFCFHRNIMVSPGFLFQVRNPEEKPRAKSMYQHGGNHLSRQRPTTTIKALSEESASKSSLGSGASSDARNASWDSQGSLASFRSSSDGSPELTPDPPRQLSGEGRRKLLSKKYRHSFIT